MKRLVTTLTPLLLSASLGIALLAQEEKKDEAAAKGKEVFEENCAVCHAADSDEQKVGPSVKGLFKKEKLKNGKAVSDESVTALIEKGGNGMPAYEDVLEKEQRAQVLAYLKTL